MIDLIWIVAMVFPILAVVNWVTMGPSINFWWLSPIIGTLIYAANRKPIMRDSLAYGFISWFFGTILGLATGYVSSGQIGNISFEFFNVSFAILNAMLGGLWAFWGGFVSVYFTLQNKEKLKRILT